MADTDVVTIVGKETPKDICSSASAHLHQQFSAPAGESKAESLQRLHLLPRIYHNDRAVGVLSDPAYVIETRQDAPVADGNPEKECEAIPHGSCDYARTYSRIGKIECGTSGRDPYRTRTHELGGVGNGVIRDCG